MIHLSGAVGHIAYSGIYDYDTAKTYLTKPVTLPFGHNVFGAVLYYNDTAEPLEMTCVCEFLDPDGVSAGQLTDVENLCAGCWKTATTNPVTLNKAGTWKLHAVLDGIEEVWDAIYVPTYIANLDGFVRNKRGDPIYLATVTLDGYTAITATDGSFQFRGLGVGSYAIGCTHPDYQDYSKSITLREGNNDIDIQMLGLEEEAPWYEKYWWALALGVGGTIVGIALLKK